MTRSVPGVRPRLRMWAALGAIGTLGALSACSVRAPAPEFHEAPANEVAALPPLAPGVALATFDSVARHVERTHYDSAMGGLDWAALVASYRDALGDDPGRTDLQRAILGLVGELETSHYTLLPGDWMPGSGGGVPGQEAEGFLDTGVDLRLVEGAIRVTRVAPGSPGEAAGLRPGDEILALDEVDVAAEAAALGGEGRAAELSRLGVVAALRHRLQSPESREPLTLVLAPGRVVHIAPAPSATPRVGFGTLLPPMAVEVAASRVSLQSGDPGADPAEGCAGVLALSAWHPAMMAPMESALRELEACQGIILDLRGNPGGILALMVPTAGQFMQEPGLLGELRTRDSEMRFQAQPRRVRSDASLAPAFDGPVAILVDELSMSTSEMFASGMQALGRARVFGVRTPGMALPALTLPLPTGDYLMYAFADYIDGEGRRIEALGVQPDSETPLTLEALVQGRDDVLAMALDWIRQAPSHPTPRN